METRIASNTDLDGIVATLSGAFEGDPLWGWAFPERRGMEAWWRLFAGSALRYPFTRIAGDFDAVAVWIPPDGIELTEADEAAIGPLLEAHLGPRAAEVADLVDRFEEHHPETPHFYLSLLGTRPASRGRGIGMALLAECLEDVDAAGAPAYLESSNPDNNPRYERHGFKALGGFSRPDDGSFATTMWREPAPVS